MVGRVTRIEHEMISCRGDVDLAGGYRLAIFGFFDR